MAKDFQKSDHWDKVPEALSIPAEFQEVWDNLPSVDAPVVKLSKKIALPIDDASVLRHPI